MPLLGALANVDEAKVKDIRGKIEAIVGQPEYRDEILDFVRSNGGLEYAAAALDRYVAQAVESLSVLPESKSKEYLVELAYFTARRKM
jgi:octaprenyl-diphosphate synthase